MVALYENIASEYEPYSVNQEYDSISSRINGSYEEMKPLGDISRQKKSLHASEKGVKRRIARRKMFAVLLSAGIILGSFGVIAIFYTRCDEGKEDIVQPTISNEAMHAVDVTKETLKVETTAGASTKQTTILRDTLPSQRNVNSAVSESLNTDTPVLTLMSDTTVSAVDSVPSTRSFEDSTVAETTRATWTSATSRIPPTSLPMSTKSLAKLPESSRRRIFPCEVKFRGTCFWTRLHGTDSTTYARAESTCRLEGGTVAFIPTVGAYHLIVNKLRSKNFHGRLAVTAWLGYQIDPMNGAVKSPISKYFLKWGPFEPNIGKLNADQTHAYLYADVNMERYTGMRNFSPQKKRDGVICQNGN